MQFERHSHSDSLQLVPILEMKNYLLKISPWTVLTLVGCIGLTVVDFWRDEGFTSWPIVRGSLPNFVAVPTLTFGLLMLRFPQRTDFTLGKLASQDRIFKSLVVFVTVGVIAWEFLQLTGNLVFDPLDLWATGGGSVVTVFLYTVLSSYSFLPSVHHSD